MTSDQFLSPPAIARLLGVAEETVYRWIRRGAIPPPTISLGGTRGYTHEMANQIVRWFRAGKSAGALREHT